MDRRVKPLRQFEALSRRGALSRRDFLRVAASASAVGAGVVLLGACASDDGNGSPTNTPGTVVDPPPETTTIRLGKYAILPCTVPLYLAGQFLPAEGFTDVQYVDVPDADPGIQQLAAGEIDFGLSFAASVTAAADQLVMLAGVHNTCWVLFGNDRVQSLRDLKGKKIYTAKRDASDVPYVFMAALLAFVGIDIKNEVEFVELSVGDVPQAVEEGTIDALLVPPPYSTGLQTSIPGLHVVLNCMMDPPWSHYFCCMATGNRDFFEKNPAATKRALRAILKAADLCAREPERAAHYLVDKGFARDFVTGSPFTYDQALDGIAGLSYAAWREFDPEDTVRFFALRHKEAGLIKDTPDELIARATDWRYLEQIKRELAV